MNKIAAIVLAAGRGKRMKAKSVNKVSLPLGNKQMILHTIDLLDKLHFNQKVVVVGFGKKSVMDILRERVIYTEQKKRLGTAHAVFCALKYLSNDVTDVLVLNGDDSAFYKEETIRYLIDKHIRKNSSITFLTIELDNPTGLGRVIRKESGKVIAIVEDKDVKEEFANIKEINPGCYVFKVSFLKKYLKKIQKSKTTGEYYLTSLVDIAIRNNENIEALKGGRLSWRGVNTQEELREAERLFLNIKR